MSATPTTKTGIEDYVIMRQPKRLGELLKLACTLIGDLPAPSHVSVSAGLQEISLGFDGTRAGVAAMADWASRYNTAVSGVYTTLTGGMPAVRCGLSFEHKGVHVLGYAYIDIQAADAA